MSSFPCCHNHGFDANVNRQKVSTIIRIAVHCSNYAKTRSNKHSDWAVEAANEKFLLYESPDINIRNYLSTHPGKGSDIVEITIDGRNTSEGTLPL